MEVGFIKSAFNDRDFPKMPWPEVAFAGRSNVGKSSLINCLLNRRNLAKTSSSPGKTRSLNFFQVGKMVFVDLPGYGYAKVPLPMRDAWRKVVESYLLKRENLRLVVVLAEIRVGLDKKDVQFIEWLRAYSRPFIVVLTKADKLSRLQVMNIKNKVQSSLEGLTPEPPIPFSSKTGLGKNELWAVIEKYSLGAPGP